MRISNLECNFENENIDISEVVSKVNEIIDWINESNEGHD